MTDDLKYTEEDLKRAKKDSEFQTFVMAGITELKEAVKLIDAKLQDMDLRKADKTVITSWETVLAKAESRLDVLEKALAKLTGALVILSCVWTIVSAIIVAWVVNFIT